MFSFITLLSVVVAAQALAQGHRGTHSILLHSNLCQLTLLSNSSYREWRDNHHIFIPAFSNFVPNLLLRVLSYRSIPDDHSDRDRVPSLLLHPYQHHEAYNHNHNHNQSTSLHHLRVCELPNWPTRDSNGHWNRVSSLCLRSLHHHKDHEHYENHDHD